MKLAACHACFACVRSLQPCKPEGYLYMLCCVIVCKSMLYIIVLPYCYHIRVLHHILESPLAATLPAGEVFDRTATKPHARTGDARIRARAKVGTGLMGTWLHGSLVLQGSIPLPTSQFKHLQKLLARERLGTR